MQVLLFLTNCLLESTPPPRKLYNKIMSKIKSPVSYVYHKIVFAEMTFVTSLYGFSFSQVIEVKTNGAVDVLWVDGTRSCVLPSQLYVVNAEV